MNFSRSAVRIAAAISLAVTLLAIAMIVFQRVLSNPDAGMTFYAVPVLLATGAGAVAWRALAVSDPSRPPGKKLPNGLVALSSAAILTVFAAGYDRTSDAADEFARRAESSRRRPMAHEAFDVMTAALAANPGSIDMPGTLPDAEGRAAQAPPAPEPFEAPAPLTPPMETAVAARIDKAAPQTPAADPDTLPAHAAPAAASSPVPAPAGVSASPAGPAAAPPSGLAAAPAPAAAAAPAAKPEEKDYPYADGTFYGRGTSRHGDVQVQLVIQSGRILAATVSNCMTQYSCDVIVPLYQQLVDIQNPNRLDNVSGATQSADAFYGGAVNALLASAQVKTFQKQFKTTP